MQQKPYGNATRLYNKHCKHHGQWHPCHPLRSAYHCQQAQLFSRQTNTWIHHHLRHGQDDFKIQSLQSADGLGKLLSEFDFGLGNNSSIEDHSQIFRTLYYRVNFKWIQFLLSHLPFQVHLSFELVHRIGSESLWLYSEINMGDWWWDMHDQLSARETIVPVICTSDKTQLPNCSGNQHALPLSLTIGNIRQDIHQTPTKCTWIGVELIHCPLQGANITDKAWHSLVGTVMAPLQNLDITGPGLKWNCADGFQRPRDPLLAAWVEDYPERVMIAQVTYGSCRMCENPKGTLMRHTTFWPLDNSRDHQVYSELLDETNIDFLHTLGAHPLCNQFWLYPLCNFYRLWQPDVLHQLLLGWVNELLHWLLKSLKARNVINRFDNRFRLVPQYQGLQCFAKRLDSVKCNSWQGNDIRGMMRTLPVNCAPFVAHFNDDGKPVAETASNEMGMRAVWGLCEFSLLVSQQTHSDQSLTAPDDALKQFYKKNPSVLEQKMWKSANTKVDKLLATESHLLWELKIDKIRDAIQVQVFRAEKVTTPTQSQFLVHLNRVWKAATKRSDADPQRTMSNWSLTSLQWHLLNIRVLIYYPYMMRDNYCRKLGLRQPVPEAHLQKTLAQLNMATEEEGNWAANTTTDMHAEYQVHLSNAETDATTWSIADTDLIVNQLERDMYCKT